MIELKIWREGTTIRTLANCDGTLGEVLEELSTGAAHMLIDMVDDMRVADKPYDGMAQAFGAMVTDAVGRILLAQEGEADGQEQESDGHTAH